MVCLRVLGDNILHDADEIIVDWESSGLLLRSKPDVWQPTYFGRIFSSLTEQLVSGRMRETGRCRVLDFGSGSGILAIVAAGLGAEVVAVDLNPSAVALTAANAKLNGVQIDAREGDCFSPIGDSEKFDLILANTPSVPGRTGVSRNTADEWNENGNGRLLLDAVLNQGPNYLSPGGGLLTANNSEQGLDQTLSLLRTHWAGHRYLRRCTFELDLEQFKPFRDLWVDEGVARKVGNRYFHFVHFLEAWI